MDFHLWIKIDHKMPIQPSFFSKKTITNRKFRIREKMWWVRTLSWLCKTWARNIMSFTSLGVESTHCPFCMGLSNMFENSVLFPIIKMSKKIRRCFDQSCTRLQVFLISYLLSVTFFFKGSQLNFSSPKKFVKWKQVKITNMILQRPVVFCRFACS